MKNMIQEFETKNKLEVSKMIMIMVNLSNLIKKTEDKNMKFILQTYYDDIGETLKYLKSLSLSNE